MIRVAICDDDPVMGDTLKKILYEAETCICEELDIVVFSSGTALIREITSDKKALEKNFHLIFLDIAMPEINGVEVGQVIRNELGNNETQIIYISSQTNYAMQLFKVRPLDFVVKPFRPEEIKQTFLKGYELIRMSKKVFAFRIGRRQEIIRKPLSQIIYFCSHGRKITVVCMDDNYEFYGSLKDVEAQLGDYRFFSIHRSYLINYNNVARMTYTEVTLVDGTTLEISQLKRRGVRDLCDSYER